MFLGKEYNCKICEILDGIQVKATHYHLDNPEDLSVCDECWKEFNFKKIQEDLGILK